MKERTTSNNNLGKLFTKEHGICGYLTPSSSAWPYQLPYLFTMMVCCENKTNKYEKENEGPCTL